jgi:hypothetical protein
MRLAKIALTGIPVIMFGVLIGASAPQPEPECVKAEKWVASNRGHLPATLTEFSKFELAYRKAIYHALPRETRLRLWHEQLAHYSRSDSLSATQRQFVDEMAAALDRVLGSAEEAEFEAINEPRAIQILGKPLARQVFANLGVGVPNPPSIVAPGSAALSGCECNTSDDWCSDGPTAPPRKCYAGGTCITPTESGCGWWWSQPCNGYCGAA